jgi:uroporphyrinogen decarboxylase
MSNLKEILINKNICKSVWFMRQAGRYLPEFKKIRSQNHSFIDLCLNSKLSSEITLQPIKRFNLDSAIIFSDILMVPYALNQEVKFERDRGPILSKFDIKKFLSNDNSSFIEKLNPVYKAIKLTRKNLDERKSLISFIGAPWTLLVYMIGAKKHKNEIDFKIVKDKKKDIKIILEKLNEYLCLHIENQIRAGADVVQIFDSWAGSISPEDLPDFCFKPNLKIVEFCKTRKIPVICFPKGIKEKYKNFNNLVKPNGINIDYNIDPIWAKENLKETVIQGGLDPKTLLLSDQEISYNAKKYLDAFKGLPYIFNLGHGMLPETNPEKVRKLIEFYRGYN